ncbi:hypothetical protein CAFE_17590 [Caprobacter fermentans]|uniref:Uncharacterized protein n=1 Tax=Caproicibacter fermentans TaxID=2576756 RepID=A0A6N8HZZ9_9FIRM|nr:hypothetical protein [Caproicibacter fermentans]MVB11057.1 hypothetical protein [Caproicibacter fermentans]
MNRTEQTVRILRNTIQHIEYAETIERAESLANMIRGFMIGSRLICVISAGQLRKISSELESTISDVKKRIKETAGGAANTEGGLGKMGIKINASITVLASGVNYAGRRP